MTSPAPLTFDQVIAELQHRERAMGSLTEFARRFVEVEPAKHHRLICEGVDGLLADDYDVLVVMSPPASAKSTYVSVAAPAYIIGRDPRTRIISVSRAAELAAEFGGRVKAIVDGEDFIAATGVTVAADTRAKDNWKTTAGGGYFAVGASGGVLGKRADVVICLVGNTQVRTKTGYTDISEIKVGQEVLTYDTEKLSPRYCRVLGVASRPADIIYRIHSADGRVVEATGNHPFYSGGKFVPAMALAVGDPLLSCVWDSEDDQCTGTGQAASQESGSHLLLQPLLRDDPRQHNASGIPDTPDLQQLWEEIHEQGTRSARRAGLLGGMSAGDTPESGSKVEDRPEPSLRPVREGVSPVYQYPTVEILLDVMPKQVAGEQDVSKGKSELATRQDPEPPTSGERSLVQGGAEDSPVSGQSRVRDLCQHGEPACAPRGRGLDKQHSHQSSDTLPEVPHDTPRSGARETAETSVARIEVVRRDETVWDIKVEHTTNFFANGLLVHNCDDIHASFEDAQSETQLQKIRNWFESDLLSRLTPTGKLIVIGQRLNANDIIGFVMQRAAENPDIRMKVLKFTAVCEDPEDDPLGRQKGERMWPEFYTDQYLADKRRDDFVWRTLWMQEPPSEDGSWVGSEHIRIVDITPSNMTFYLLSDLALSVNKGDYSVHITAGVHSDGSIYVEDAWRDRCAIEKTVEKHLDLVETFHPAESLIDDDNAAKVYVQLLATKARERGVAVPWKQMPMRGQDKETRAAPLRGMFRSGRVAFKRAPWNRWLINEIMMFPNAMGAGVDDGVDALSLIGRRLASLARPSAAAPPPRPPKTWQDMTLDEMWSDREATVRMGKRI